MAARASIFPIQHGFEDMAGATNAEILKWLTEFDRRNDDRLKDIGVAIEKNGASVSALNGIVAGLAVKVETVQTQVISLGAEVKEKASRPELEGVVLRFKEDLSRVERSVGEDVDGFRNMYESVVNEIGALRDKIEPALKKIDSMDERLRRIEPLDGQAQEAKGFINGAAFAARVLYVVLGALLGAGIVKVVFK